MLSSVPACYTSWPWVITREFESTFHLFHGSVDGMETRGALNFGLRATCHQKDPTFFLLAFTERPPFLPTFTQWHHIFDKLLVTEKPWHIFVTQRPLIFAFNSQISDNFPQKKKKKNFRKFWQIWRNVEKFLALKAPIFWWISLKDPFFCTLCHQKTPTSEALGGTRTSLSYVSAPHGIGPGFMPTRADHCSGMW